MIDDKVFEEYCNKFGGYPFPQPLGYCQASDEDVIRHIKSAIETGKPIDWEEILDPIPEGVLD